MSKAIFFDADGVTVLLREKFFSQRLSEDCGVPLELILPLFKNEYYKCVLGEMDLKEVLKFYITAWNWKGSMDELLQYWWAGENKINTQVLDVINKIRAQGIKCYLVTDQEKYRANYIMKDMGLENYFDGTFFSSDLGLSKATKEYWGKVLETLNINPKEAEFWDDETENVQAAKEAGIIAYLYSDINDLQKYI